MISVNRNASTWNDSGNAFQVFQFLLIIMSWIEITRCEVINLMFAYIVCCTLFAMTQNNEREFNSFAF